LETLVIGLGLVALLTATGVVSLKNPVHCAVSLIAHMVTLAALFIVLNAEFLAMVQVIVYAGAVVVLFLFILAYLGTSGREDINKITVEKKVIFTLSAVVILEMLCLMMIPDSTIKESVSPVETEALPFGGIELLSHELFSRFFIPFELASILLLIAAVGILALVKRSKKHKELIKEITK